MTIKKLKLTMIQLYKLNEFQIKFQLKRMFIMLTFKRIKSMH